MKHDIVAHFDGAGLGTVQETFCEVVVKMEPSLGRCEPGPLESVLCGESE